MHKEPFQSGYVTEEELENPFRKIVMLHGKREDSRCSRGSGTCQLTATSPGSSPKATLTKIFQGDLAITRELLKFSVPIEFVISGRKFLILISLSSSYERSEFNYIVNAGDGSSIKVAIIAVRPSSKLKPGINIQIESTNKTGRKANMTFIYPHLGLEKSDRIINEFRNVVKNIDGTDIWMFLKAFPVFGSVGHVNPKSVLANPDILLGSTLKKFRLWHKSLPSTELEEGEFDIALAIKCGGAMASCILGLPSAVGVITIPLITARCGAADVECLDFLIKTFPGGIPPLPPPPKCSPGEVIIGGMCMPANRDEGCSPGTVLIPDPASPGNNFFCGPIGGRCPPGMHVEREKRTGINICVSDKIRGPKPPVTPKPSAIGEKIRWIQTILKVAGGESDLIVDGIAGPRTSKALLRFQRRFGLIINGVVGPFKTTTALTQLALNHIFSFQFRKSQPVVLSIDGIMGPKTIKAIEIFQSTYKSGPVDGIVGPITRAAMVEALNLNASSRLTFPGF